MRHPNIVRLYESLETELAYYLILELIEGGEMKDYIAKSDRLGEEETKKYMRQLISAAWHIHSAGVVHRDLKVENIMLSKTGDIKIIDFGLSNCFKSLESKGGKGTQCGSPAYAAPELLANKGYDKRVDIWAIGINMFAMLVGKLPFKVKPFNLKKLYQKMMSGDMESLPAGTSQGARDILTRLLQPDPQERITLKECSTHVWLAGSPEVVFINSPNFPVNDDLNQEVLQFMELSHNVNVHSLILDILTHTTNGNTATYHYMCNKFNRYIVEQNKIAKGSEVTQTSLATLAIKKDTRRSSRPKLIKRRPRTAAGGTIKRETSDSGAPHSPLKTRKSSVGAAPKKMPVVECTLPYTKRAFLVKPDPKCPHRADETISNDIKLNNDAKLNNITITKLSNGVGSETKTPEPSVALSKMESVSLLPNTNKDAGTFNKYRCHQSEHTKTRPPDNDQVPNDGKVNWRQTPLIKTKYYPSDTNNTVNFRTDYKSTPHVEYEARRPRSGSWLPSPTIRQNSTRSSADQRTLTERQVSSYKWRNDLYRTKLGINKNSVPVYHRNMSFPEQLYKPQYYRSYTFR